MGWGSLWPHSSVTTTQQSKMRAKVKVDSPSNQPGPHLPLATGAFPHSPSDQRTGTPTLQTQPLVIARALTGSSSRPRSYLATCSDDQSRKHIYCKHCSAWSARSYIGDRAQLVPAQMSLNPSSSAPAHSSPGSGEHTRPLAALWGWGCREDSPKTEPP